MAPASISTDELQRLERDRFVELFGGVFEHAPWVAERGSMPVRFTALETLHGAMVEAMRRAPRARQLALIHGHPDLAGRAAIARELTAASRRAGERRARSVHAG